MWFTAHQHLLVFAYLWFHVIKVSGTSLHFFQPCLRRDARSRLFVPELADGHRGDGVTTINTSLRWLNISHRRLRFYKYVCHSNQLISAREALVPRHWVRASPGVCSSRWGDEGGKEGGREEGGREGVNDHRGCVENEHTAKQRWLKVVQRFPATALGTLHVFLCEKHLILMRIKCPQKRKEGRRKYSRVRTFFHFLLRAAS